MPGYSVLQPLTPLQPVFGMPGNSPATFDLSAQSAASAVLSSKVLQTPMSQLSYLNTTTEWCPFPAVEAAGTSHINTELLDRELAALCSQQSELLTRQVSGLSGL